MIFSRLMLKASIFSLVFLSAGVFSEEKPASTSGLWLLAKYDVNGDHQISVNEIAKKREKMFTHMDGDQDGSVSFSEYQTLDTKRRQLILKARFNKLDLDQNGHVDTQEYSSYVGSFDRFDKNGDGRITTKEMTIKPSSVKSKKLEDDSLCLLWVCFRSSLD